MVNMSNHRIPDTWQLDSKTDDELLAIAKDKLFQRTRRYERELSVTPKWRWVKYKKNRSRFFSHWYASMALVEYRNRR